jgi:hypothetical protein
LARGPGDEAGEILDRRLAGHDDAEGIAGDPEDVGEVLDRVPGDAGGVGQAEDAQRDLRQGVAVGAGLLHGLRGQRATGPGPVLDDHLLAQQLARALGQRAHGQVGGAAGRKGNEQPHRLRRPGALRAQHRGARHEAGGSGLDEGSA